MNNRERDMAKVLERSGMGYMLGEMYRFADIDPGGAIQGGYGQDKIASMPIGDQMGEAQQLGTQERANRISVSVVMFQKASQLRKQAEALSVLGRQLQEVEKRQATEMRMGADLTDALMTVFR